MSKQRITLGETARDFSLKIPTGTSSPFPNLIGQKNVYLVFNRGFS